MKATVLAAAGLLGVTLSTSTPAFGQTELPKPTGRYGIGRSILDWTDPARPEPQSGKAGARRELLVYLFYPADPETRGVRAEYFPRLKEVEAYEERFGKNFFRESYGDSYKTISALRSHAVENAPLAAGGQPARRRGYHP